MLRCCGRAEKKAFMKILIVDDHVLIREALRSVLQELKGSATVLEASNCCQAMELTAAHADIGLILLDLNLPDRDGFSVLAELRERHPAISAVVLSGAETARREAEENLQRATERLEDTEEELERTGFRIRAAEAELARAEDRIKATEARALTAERAFKQLEQAIRAQLIGLEKSISARSAHAA